MPEMSVSTASPRQIGKWLSWITASRAIAQAMSWGSTILVMRLLEQHDYGVMAIATLYTTFAAILLDIGLGASLLRHREDPGREAQAFSVALMVGTFACVVLGGLGVLLARLYDTPELALVLPVLSLSFLIGPIGLIQEVRLGRNMAFKQRALLDVAVTALSSIATIAAALAGWGVWALVVGGLIAGVIRLALLLPIAGGPPKPVWPRWLEVSEFVTFGRDFSVSRFALFLETNVDRFIAAKFMSTAELGVYAAANYWSQTPLGRIMAISNTLLFPIAAQLHRDGGDVRGPVIQSLRLHGLVAFPLYWLMAATSHDLVLGLLGERWSAAAPMILVLCIAMPFRILVEVTDTFLRIDGKGSIVMQNHSAGAIAILLLSVLLVQSGPLALAQAIAVATLASAAFSLYRSLPRLGVPLAAGIRAATSGIGIGLALVVASTTAQGMLASWAAVPRLAATLFVALGVFVGLLGVLERTLLMSILTGNPTSAPDGRR